MMKSNDLKNSILKTKIYIITAFLSILLAQFGISLSAEDSVFNGKSYFICKSGATIKIKRSSHLLIKSNLQIESNVVGEGDLIIRSSRRVYIDADSHSIESLVIDSPDSVDLISTMKIVRSLRILDGGLVLNDFFLYLRWDTEINRITYQRIFENGKGEIMIGDSPSFRSRISYISSPNMNFYFSQSSTLRDWNRGYILVRFTLNIPMLIDISRDVYVPPPIFISA